MPSFYRVSSNHFSLRPPTSRHLLESHPVTTPILRLSPICTTMLSFLHSFVWLVIWKILYMKFEGYIWCRQTNERQASGSIFYFDKESWLLSIKRFMRTLLLESVWESRPVWLLEYYVIVHTHQFNWVSVLYTISNRYYWSSFRVMIIWILHLDKCAICSIT